MRLCAAACLLAMFVPADVTQAQDADPTQVEAALIALREQLAFPGDTAEQAARNLRTPDSALEFVQNEIVYLGYPGAYAGPAAMLRTRVGNCTDKARLLREILKQQGYETRLVSAAWPEDAMPFQGTGPQHPLPALDELARALNQPQSPIGDDTAPAVDADALRQEVLDSMVRIADVLEAEHPQGLGSAEYPSERTEQDWVWVQLHSADGRWVDLDPVFGELPRPEEIRYFPTHPVQLTLRVLAGGQPVLEFQKPCDDVLGYDVQLSLLPADKPVGAAENPAGVTSWRPLLTVGPMHTMGNAFTPKIGAGAGVESLDVEITFTDDTPDAPWSKTCRRRIQQFGPGTDPHQLIAQYRFVIGMGVVPPRVVETRLIDEVLAIAELIRRASSPDGFEFPAARGHSSRSCRLLNEMLSLQAASLPRFSQPTPVAWQGPAVMLESTTLAKSDELTCIQRLDILQSAYGPTSDRARRIMWGLATCTAESQLLEGSSVNRQLLDAKELTLYDADDELPAWFSPLHRRVVDGGGVVIASNDSAACWAIAPDGELLGTVSTDGVLAKGVARSMPTGGRVYVAGSTAAMIMTGNPATLAFAGLVGYFQELSRLYGSVARRIEGIGDLIAGGGSSPSPFASQDDDLRGLGQDLIRELAAGALRGWSNSVIGSMIAHGLPLPVPPTGGRPPASIAIQGLIGGALTLPEEMPVLSGLIESSLDAVVDSPSDGHRE